MEKVKEILEMKVVKNLIIIIALFVGANITIDNFFSHLEKSLDKSGEIVVKTTKAAEKIKVAADKTQVAAEDTKKLVKEFKGATNRTLNEVKKIQKDGVQVNVNTDLNLEKNIEKMEPMVNNLNKSINSNLSKKNIQELAQILSTSADETTKKFEESASNVIEEAEKKLEGTNIKVKAEVNVGDEPIHNEEVGNGYVVEETLATINDVLKNK